MTLPRKSRELLIFLCGTLLGIFGNLFAEYFVAATYPQGIPQKAAEGGVMMMALLMIIYGALVGYMLTRKPTED